MERKKVEKTSLIQINWLDKLFLETYKNQLQINCQINQFFFKKELLSGTLISLISKLLNHFNWGMRKNCIILLKIDFFDVFLDNLWKRSFKLWQIIKSLRLLWLIWTIHTYFVSNNMFVCRHYDWIFWIHYEI